MAPSYYSILSKAAQGKDAAARLSLYEDARALVARLKIGPDRTEEDIAAQANALESAISQIEDDVAASYREEIGPEQLDRILSSGPNWGRIAATDVFNLRNSRFQGIRLRRNVLLGAIGPDLQSRDERARVVVKTQAGGCIFPLGRLRKDRIVARRHRICFGSLSYRWSILNSTFGPQSVQPAGNREFRLRSDIALVDLSVIADGLHGARGPIL